MTAGRLAAAFERARAGGRAAFLPYLTAGDPAAGGAVRLGVELAAAGADVLEIGVPFSDPVADGPVLQRSARRALDRRTTLDDVWKIAAALRRRTDLALLLFSYINPLVRRGVARAAREAQRAGFDGVLVTDLPPDEAGDVVAAFRGAGLATVFLASPTSTPERMAAAARLSSGFLYVVSRTGTTGERDALPAGLRRTVANARRAASRLPIAVGFGISTPRTAAQAAALADGVVVGSALVHCAETTDRPEAVRDLAARLARACRKPSPRTRRA